VRVLLVGWGVFYGLCFTSGTSHLENGYYGLVTRDAVLVPGRSIAKLRLIRNEDEDAALWREGVPA